MLRISGLDSAAADARLVFTNIALPANAQQTFRNLATVTLRNDGVAPISITEALLAGADADAFRLEGLPPTLAAGASAQVTVRFVGRDAVDNDQATLFRASLRLATNDPAQPPQLIQLAGLGQNRSELGEEPTVAQVVQAFGYGTNVAQAQLADGGLVETIGDEVLMPYLERLDPTRSVEVIQLAAFLQQGNVARLGFHGLGSSATTNLFANDDQQGQTVLPTGLVAGSGDTGGLARGTIASILPFGIHITVDGRPTFASWSDPNANDLDPQFGQLVAPGRGHLIRFFRAETASGQAIAGSYIGIQDYPGGGNFDYNDHMFLIRNVKPHVLTLAEDGNRDGVNDAVRRDSDGDGTVDFFDPVGLSRGAYVVGFNIGGAAVTSQAALEGVALRADTDPLIRYAGDGLTRGPRFDSATGLNGANALPGAFQTARDGKDWTIAVAGLKDGLYVVGLHSQELYWNATGRRVFDIRVNGDLVADNLDPFARAGAGDLPVTIEALVTVTNGRFTVQMDALAPDGVDNATISAITVHAATTNPNGGLAGAQSAFPGPNAPLISTGSRTIDASFYDTGGEGVAYHDAAGLQGTGNTNGGRTGSAVEQNAAGDVVSALSGDWLEYSLTLAAAGAYDVDLLLGSGGTGRAVRVDFFRPGDAIPYVTTGTIPNLAGPSPGAFSARGVDALHLDAGPQVLRVTFESGEQQFRSFTLTKVVPAQTPFPGPSPASFLDGMLRLDASDYDNGGQGIAYNDLPGLQGGTNGGRTGSSVEQTTSGDIGFIGGGEWLEYTIRVAESGSHDLDLLLATGGTSSTVRVDFYKPGQATPYESTGSIANPSTGGYFTFVERGVDNLDLEAGQQVVRVTFGGAQNFRSLTLAHDLG